PDGTVHVEHLDVVEDRREVRVVCEVLDDTVGVRAALRNKRTGNSGDREQQEQKQRRAHARQLPPDEAKGADEAQLRLHDVVRWTVGALGSARVNVIRWS